MFRKISYKRKLKRSFLEQIDAEIDLMFFFNLSTLGLKCLLFKIAIF
jgi:hypothetical protein